MTVVILHPPARTLPPYPEWLADLPCDLVLVTGQTVSVPRAGYAQIRSVTDYRSSARVETTVLEIAATTELTAIVATDVIDHIRVGGIRGHLQLAGPSLSTVIGLVDAVQSNELLRRAGVPAVPREGVRAAVDLFMSAHRWGYPLRLRSRRAAGWPTIATLRNQAELRAFCRRSLPPSQVVMPSLVVEPVIVGDRHRAVLVPGGDPRGACGGAPGLPGPQHIADLAGHLHDALIAVKAVAGWPHEIEAVRGPAGGWLIDTINCDPLSTERQPGPFFRAIVRAQARTSRTLSKVI